MGREARRNRDKWKSRPSVLDRFRPEPTAEETPAVRRTPRMSPQLAGSLAVFAALGMMDGRKGPRR